MSIPRRVFSNLDTVGQRMPDRVCTQLRTARLAAGRTVVDVAAALNYRHVAIVRWESGERVPTIDQVQAWAAELGLVIEARPVDAYAVASSASASEQLERS